MKKMFRRCFQGVVAVIILAVMSGAVVSSQQTETAWLCVDDPDLQLIDPDDDGILTSEELEGLSGQVSDHPELQVLIERVDSEGLQGIQYDGRCDARDQDGNVQGTPSTGVPVSGEICEPNAILGLGDENDDGVLSIEEIDGIIEMVGGNEELEAIRDQAVDAGITGIRYRDCVPGTPAASPVATPVNATPAATPAVSTFNSDTERSTEGGSEKSTRPVVLAFAGSSALLLGAIGIRALRKS